MQALAKDFQSFHHFHNLSMQKFRFHSKIIAKLKKESEDKDSIIRKYCKKHGIQKKKNEEFKIRNNPNSFQVKLYDILEI
mmetsp:Transcript_17189/g.26564  ORF Transcript_17189/g.26564 Transcript_17189/m.26564 type:complete len:80 (+) Transcript_17189:41-280(+)